VLRFGRLWYGTPDNAIGYAMHSSRSHDAVIRVYDPAGNVMETHEHKSDFQTFESAPQFLSTVRGFHAPMGGVQIRKIPA